MIRESWRFGREVELDFRNCPCAGARATTTAARSAECFYTMRVVNRLSLYIKFLQTTSCDTLTSTHEKGSTTHARTEAKSWPKIMSARSGKGQARG